jgi:hypothetical protein
MTTQSGSYRRQDRSLRYTFTYEGEDLTLASKHYLDKVSPASDPIEKEDQEKERSGFWIELQDEKRRTLYRKAMHNPRFHAEVTTPAQEEKRGGSFTNVRLSDPKGTFFVTVPNIPEAQDLVIFSSPLGYEAVPGPAAPIARFNVRSGEESE